MNAKVSTDTKVVTRQADAAPRRVEADICVVGAGIAGTSAALTAARAGRRVVLLDGLPVLGGQAVNSIVGTFCGLFANGTHGHQFTHGIADEILRDLVRRTVRSITGMGRYHIVYYDEVALGPLDRGSDPPSRHHCRAWCGAATRRRRGPPGPSP